MGRRFSAFALLKVVLPDSGQALQRQRVDVGA